MLFIVTTSPCQDWVICAPAAFLGCGSRFSGSLSAKGVEIYVGKVAPLGDPIEITVRGYELSLRKADAEMIEIE